MRCVFGVILLLVVSRGRPRASRVFFNDGVYFYDSGSRALYNILKDRLLLAGLCIDEGKIQSVCVEDTVMGNPLFAGLYMQDCGEIILSRDMMEEPLLAYWVLAHEVLHSQGAYEHDPESLLMCPSAYGYWYAIVFGHSIDSIVELEYRKYIR